MCVHLDLSVQASSACLLSQHSAQSAGCSSVSLASASLQPPYLSATPLRDEQIFLINSELGDHLVVKRTTSFLEALPLNTGEAGGSEHMRCEWGRSEGRVLVTHAKPVRQFSWHCKGDYLAAVTADGKCVQV